MSAADPRLELACRWLAHARADLSAAHTLNRSREDNEPYTAAFHAQQAAEKSLKAALVFFQIDPGRDHDLTRLLASIPASLGRTKSLSGLASLNPYAVSTRYPQPGGTLMSLNLEPDWNDAEAAIELASLTVSAVAADLADAGLLGG